MKMKLFVLASIALCGVVGCIPTSINPLYTAQDLVFDPALVGVWSGDGDSKEKWAFEKEGDTAYKLVYTDDEGKTGRFEAHLVKLGDTQFLDLFPDESGIEEMNQSVFYKLHLLRAHSFLKVTRITPALQMAPLDLKWLRDYLAKYPKAIAHQKFGEGDDAQIVLTASTPELRKFVVKHLSTEGAFGDPINLKRHPSETKPQK